MEDKSNREDIELFLKDSFKGLSKEYIIDKIFDEDIQRKWKPQVGDVIVGCTGNIFVLAGSHYLTQELGGELFFFAPSLCNRSNGCTLNSTHCSTLNKNGKQISKEITPSKFSDYRFVPYPHEL